MANLKWVEDRCRDLLLPALAQASTEEEVKQLSLKEIEYWRSRVTSEDSLRNPHTQSRQIIKNSALPEQTKAWTLQHLNLGEAKWTELNLKEQRNVSARLENQLLLRNPDRIVVQAEALLDGERWQDLAAGLAVSTGRRLTEVLKTAEFEYKTPYSVVFRGQLKQKGNTIADFEIPTLAPAELVVKALTRLRALLDTSEMSEGEVSNSYHRAVSASVKQHFVLLIPARDGESISTQTMRAIYLRLALFFYCPVLVNVDAFIAEISGHRSYFGDQEVRGHGANVHYNDYAVSDQEGNIDGRQGVKLGQAGVEVLSVFSGSYDGSGVVSEATRGIVSKEGVLIPESLFTGPDLELIKEGMAAANMTDFMSYLTTALKRQAKTDLGLAKRDTVQRVSELSMDELARMRKRSTAMERIRRAIQAIAKHNDESQPLERWYINATVLSYLTKGRFQTILDYLKEHEEEVNSLNSKYNLTEKFNRKPVRIDEVITVE